MSPKDHSLSVTVEGALGMQEHVTHAPEGLTDADVSRKLQIPKSSAGHILRTLERRGYLNRDPQSGAGTEWA